MCGEYDPDNAVNDVNIGSPPHVWRIRSKLYKTYLPQRITSTCVENTIFSLCGFFCFWDHLHMCGEYQKLEQTMTKPLGSPPHVWRIHSIYFWLGRSNGITSTCVENTNLLWLIPKMARDHLHMCGEYVASLGCRRGEAGSPPHVWRIHRRHNLATIPTRITSTCVENTQTAQFSNHSY